MSLSAVGGVSGGSGDLADIAKGGEGFAARMKLFNEATARVEAMLAMAKQAQARADQTQAQADKLHAENTATGAKLKQELAAASKLQATLAAKIKRIEAAVGE